VKTKKVSFKDIISSNKPVLVDFSAEWCGPCKAMAPVLQQVASKVGDKARIVKIDVDRNPTLASKYKVQGVPTFMIFKKGKMLWRQSGMQPMQSLVSLLEKEAASA